MQQVAQPSRFAADTEQAAPQMARLDPSASKLKYRIERLMLTPLFRFGMRVVLPFALCFGAGGLWFSVEDNRDAFNLMLSDVRNTIESRPEFQVKLMAIDGASAGVAEDIREILPVDFPVSSFDLDLDGMQVAVVGLDAVRKADVRVRQGVLQVDVIERVPAVLWRREASLEMLDRKGNVVGPIDSRFDRPDLPVIAGEGAEAAVPEMLELLAVSGPLTGRLRGFERMAGRRWDVVLDRGQRILLPEEGAVTALERTIAMDQAVNMLARDIAVVDLRLPHRPTIRMQENAVQELLRIKALEQGGDRR